MTELEKWNEKTKIDIPPEVEEELDKTIDLLLIPNVKDFVKTVVMTESDIYKINTTLEISNILLKYLQANNRYHPEAPTKDSIAMLAAVLLHNIYFDQYDNKEDWRHLFDLRAETQALANELTDQENYGIFNWMYQIVESQLGYDTPVPNCCPVPNQFTHLVWEVLWFYYHTDCSYVYGYNEE